MRLDETVFEVLGVERAIAAFTSYDFTTPNKSSTSSPFGAATRRNLDDTMTRVPTSLRCLAVPLLCASCMTAAAQDPAEIAAAGAVAPVAAPAQPDAADIRPIVETNPSVRAALELPRREPADYLRAIGWLIDLDRSELAKPILVELTKLQLTDAQQAALVGEFGSGALLKLARSKELAPAGAQFADACMAAANAAANDPQRIAQLVAQLTDPSAEVRVAARNDLAAVGRTGVVAALEALARERMPTRRRWLLDAAAEMQPLVVGPLLAMLSTNDMARHAEVSESFGTTRYHTGSSTLTAKSGVVGAGTAQCDCSLFRRHSAVCPRRGKSC